MKKTSFILYTLTCFIGLTVNIALAASELPLSLTSKALPIESSIELPELDKQALFKEDITNQALGVPMRYAINKIDTDNHFEKQGQWSIQGENSIWRVPVKSKDAVSLSFAFENLFLPAGAKLFIHNGTSQNIIGPFTDKDNKKHQKLWTPDIIGSSAIVEINVPTKLKPYLSFDLKQVSQAYRGTKATNGAKSGSCNIDVVCSDGDDWRAEIRSVASFTFDKNGSRFVCTGQLVNNTAEDRRALFLTANHCVDTPTVAQSMVIAWNYETSVCGGTPDGNRNAQTQTGARLLASWGDTNIGNAFADMTLVELDQAPDPAFNVHFAGWDNNDVAPTSVVAIHHPSGDEKRISFENDPLTVTNYLSPIVNPNANYLRVSAWNLGTTEGGSSGSGIWNSDKRIVGTLSGGTASCNDPNDPDYYGRIAAQWEGGGTPETQLKAWLDPTNSDAKVLDGVDACVAPTVSFTANPNPAIIGDPVTFTANVSGGSTGTYTYAWDFDGDGNTDSTDASPTFTYTAFYQGNVNLDVTDSSCSTTSTVAIVADRAGGNTAPVATLSSTQITVTEGDTVSLDASGSSDANSDPLTFLWAQTAGTNVVINNGKSAVATFVSPDITSDANYSFEVTVSDNFGGSDTARVDVTVQALNDAPVASVANASITANEGSTVTLDASSSTDANTGDTLSYVWEQTAGPTVTLNNSTQASASFTAPSVTATTSLTFEVTVNDGNGAEDKATVNVSVNDVPPPAPPSSGGGGGGSLNFMFFLLFSLGFLNKMIRFRTVSRKEQ